MSSGETYALQRTINARKVVENMSEANLSIKISANVKPYRKALKKVRWKIRIMRIRIAIAKFFYKLGAYPRSEKTGFNS